MGSPAREAPCWIASRLPGCPTRAPARPSSTTHARASTSARGLLSASTTGNARAPNAIRSIASARVRSAGEWADSLGDCPECRRRIHLLLRRCKPESLQGPLRLRIQSPPCALRPPCAPSRVSSSAYPMAAAIESRSGRTVPDNHHVLSEQHGAMVSKRSERARAPSLSPVLARDVRIRSSRSNDLPFHSPGVRRAVKIRR